MKKIYEEKIKRLESLEKVEDLREKMIEYGENYFGDDWAVYDIKCSLDALYYISLKFGLEVEFDVSGYEEQCIFATVFADKHIIIDNDVLDNYGSIEEVVDEIIRQENIAREVALKYYKALLLLENELKSGEKKSKKRYVVFATDSFDESSWVEAKKDNFDDAMEYAKKIAYKNAELLEKSIEEGEGFFVVYGGNDDRVINYMVNGID